MYTDELSYITDIGIALSSEKDFGVLLELILNKVMELTNCDGGTLYLLNGDHLDFHVMCTRSLNIYQGNKGNPCTLPPVPLTGSSVSALCVLKNQTIVIDDVYQCTEYDLSGPLKYDKLTGYHSGSILVVPLRERFGGIIGVLQLLNAQNADGKVIPFPQKYIRIVEAVASQAAVTIENMRYLNSIRDLFQSFVRVLSTAIDERTPYNENHTRNMVRYGEKFIAYLNQVAFETESIPCISDETAREILMSIWFHDIGKLVTPLEIMNKSERLLPEDSAAIRIRFERMKLLTRIQELEGHIDADRAADFYRQLDEAEKIIFEINLIPFNTDEHIASVKAVYEKVFMEPNGQEYHWLTENELEKLCIRKGTLTENERRIMEQHVVITEKLLDQISFTSDLSHVKDWATSHHEFLNGMGYPDHLKNDEIPREVRIITILDIFDALVAADRPYKKGLPPERAISILKEMADKEGKLDSGLVTLFEASKCWL